MIRPFDEADADAAAALLAEHNPWLTTAAGLLHRNAKLPPRAHRAVWVAELDGAIVGYGEAEFDWTAERTDVGQVWALVDPSRRARGLGSELLRVATEHVTARGATELRSWSFAEGDAFLERRGFSRAREERLSALDPRTIDTSAVDELAPGVRVASLGELDDRRRDVYELFAEALEDMPADHPERRFSFEEFEAETLGDPDLSHAGSAVVLDGDRPVALSFVGVDGVRGVAEQHLTGTARSHRRRGLARVAKLAVIRWCAGAGVTRLMTGNDSQNAAMLALNDALGFRPFATETEWVKPNP
ncbi:MAG TPA: GNAT family N-acetyltransferase [Gaiellaceae bacterium]|nr:GNAT family N-acetyltransferase [Gaiellaceae bacterium]